MGFLIDAVIDWLVLGLVEKLPRFCLIALGAAFALMFAVLLWFVLSQA
jgi:hypothetical protein